MMHNIAGSVCFSWFFWRDLDEEFFRRSLVMDASYEDVEQESDVMPKV